MRSIIEHVHGGYVANRRISVLASGIAALLPPSARVLDVGAGDGLLAARILAVRPDVRIEGVDVLVREGTAIPVRAFDGERIPYEDGSVDLVMMVDVLHHTDDPAVLLRESMRVARAGILIKDHLREGRLAGAVLRTMDRVGNARHGVRLPYNYWSRAQWDLAFHRLGLSVQRWQSRLHLYPPPASWIFDRSLHFLALLGIEERSLSRRADIARTASSASTALSR